MNTPVVKAAMLIRKPVAEVFEAFVNPAITTQFWFTKSSGRLEEGKAITWEWEMYQFSSTARVITIRPEQQIILDWQAGDQTTSVTWSFRSLEEGTFVEVINSGFSGDREASERWLVESTDGFTLSLAGAKAWLEHQVRLNLVGDRFPQGLQ